MSYLCKKIRELLSRSTTIEMRVIIDKAIPYIKGILEPYAEVAYCDGREIDAERIKLCDAMIIRTRTHCNRELLEGSNIRFIATATIGTDHIDEEYCHKAGITVARAAGCNARGVLQWVAAALRHISLMDNKQPSGYTLGVVGVGNVGRNVAHYARHWGFRVMECDPPRQMREGGEFYSIAEIAEQCDIITLHTPLNSDTRHMVNSELIGRMRPNATIINASRGAVADNRAVKESGHRYIFDVWEGEPSLDADILQSAELATPHIAGYSKQGKANATAMVISQFADFFELPIKGWYPPEVTPVVPRDIEWQEMVDSIEQYCPIIAQTEHLKSNPTTFESQRNNYDYREEYF